MDGWDFLSCCDSGRLADYLVMETYGAWYMPFPIQYSGYVAQVVRHPPINAHADQKSKDCQSARSASHLSIVNSIYARSLTAGLPAPIKIHEKLVLAQD